MSHDDYAMNVLGRCGEEPEDSPEPCDAEVADLSSEAGRPLTKHEATLYRVRQLHARIVRDMLEGKS